MNPTASPSPRTRTATRRVGVLTLTGLAALGLSSCGNDVEPDTVGAPIVLSSTASPGAGDTASPTPSPTGSGPDDSSTASASGGAAPVAAVVRDDEANVDVDDQTGDGRSVLVREVRLTAGTGHVVVIDPRTRQVLGTTLVRSGTSRDLTVTLPDAVGRSGELVALLHSDDGDGRFDPATDGAVVEDDDREPVDEDFDYRVR